MLIEYNERDYCLNVQIHFDSSLFFVWKTQQQELTERRQDKIKKEGVIKF